MHRGRGGGRGRCRYAPGNTGRPTRGERSLAEGHFPLDPSGGGHGRVKDETLVFGDPSGERGSPPFNRGAPRKLGFQAPVPRLKASGSSRDHLPPPLLREGAGMGPYSGPPCIRRNLSQSSHGRDALRYHPRAHVARTARRGGVPFVAAQWTVAGAAARTVAVDRGARSARLCDAGGPPVEGLVGVSRAGLPRRVKALETTHWGQ